jgi:hypothetical protein
VALLKWLSEQRSKQILGHADAHLTDGEQIVHWARARHTGEQKHGLVFITTHRLLVLWPSKGEDHSAIAWTDIDNWDIDQSQQAGPILTIDTSEGQHAVQTPVVSPAAANHVTEFLLVFAELAPWARGRATDPSEPEIKVDYHRQSVQQMTRRIGLTILGGTLVVGGIAIIPLPGPWSFPVIIAGLVVLSSEYDWADDLLGWVRDKYELAKKKLVERRAKKS